MFDVGQRVICVSRLPTDPKRTEKFPVKGQVYTIRNSFLHEIRGYPVVRLVEIVNAPREYMEDVSEVRFKADHFRPIDEEHLYGLRDLLVTPPKEKVGV